MELQVPAKLKKCSVRVNRMAFIGVSPAEVQEQILDRRIRKCSVRVQRCNEVKLRRMTMAAVAAAGSAPGYKMRRCCIRLPRINLVGSEISSSPVSSVVLADDGKELGVYRAELDACL